MRCCKIALLFGILLCFGCERKSNDTHFKVRELQNDDEQDSQESLSSPTRDKTKRTSPDNEPDYYETNWRLELSVPGSEGAIPEVRSRVLLAAANRNIQELEQLGLKVDKNEGFWFCKVNLQPQNLEADGSIKPAIVNKLRFAGVDNIRVVRLPFSDSGTLQFDSFRCLRELWVQGTDVTDAGLQGLKKVEALRSVAFPGEMEGKRSKITGEGFNALQNLPALDKVDLPRASITDAGLRALGAVSSIESLSLKDDQITDSGLSRLRSLQKLSFLYLDNNPLTGTGFKDFSPLRKRNVVQLVNCPITDEGVIEIAKLRLVSLSLAGTKVTDLSAKLLSKTISLETLNLSRTAITDAAIPSLAALPALEELDLQKTKITDAGLGKLGSFEKLRTLSITNGQFSQAAIDKLKDGKSSLIIRVGE